MNRVILTGRLVKDPELKHTSNNIPYVQFTIAVNRPFAAKDSNAQQADFISCVVWRQAAENLARYIKKGGLIGIEGRIQSRTYDDASGTRQYTMDVVCDSIEFLEPKSKSDSSGDYDYRPRYEEPKRQEQKQSKDPFENVKSNFDISDDDLPF
ncbi:MAG: single-stranded DNA-binding protein [Bacilli bacterium]|jgi:single-strand DNA-binding protein